jgi:hypothetical protein
VKVGDRVATVLRLSPQVGDSEVLGMLPTIVGRAIVDTDGGDRYHAVIVSWDLQSRVGGRLVGETRTGALYFDPKAGAFVTIEVPK